MHGLGPDRPVQGEVARRIALLTRRRRSGHEPTIRVHRQRQVGRNFRRSAATVFGTDRQDPGPVRSTHSARRPRQRLYLRSRSKISAKQRHRAAACVCSHPAHDPTWRAQPRDPELDDAGDHGACQCAQEHVGASAQVRSGTQQFSGDQVQHAQRLRAVVQARRHARRRGAVAVRVPSDRAPSERTSGGRRP